jgi:hypothetical protein
MARLGVSHSACCVNSSTSNIRNCQVRYSSDSYLDMKQYTIEKEMTQRSFDALVRQSLRNGEL